MKCLARLFQKKKTISAPTITAKVNHNLELLKIAQGEIGVAEIGGNNHGPQVANYLDDVGLEEGSPWCAAFLAWSLNETEKKFKIKSNVFRSGHVLTMWRRTAKMLRVDMPKPGDLVLWQYGTTERGHCGIVESINDDGTEMTTIEGNSRPGHRAIVREGDMVARHTHSLDHSDNFTLLGFIRPFNESL